MAIAETVGLNGLIRFDPQSVCMGRRAVAIYEGLIARVAMKVGMNFEIGS